MTAIILASADLPGEMPAALSGLGYRPAMIGITDLIKHVSTPSSFAELMVIDPPQWTQGGELGIAFARRFVEDVRKLPRDAAMWDGRKWSGIPISSSSIRNRAGCGPSRSPDG